MVVGSDVRMRVSTCGVIKEEKEGGKGVTGRAEPVRYVAGLYSSFGRL
jgi:hypothetical protein